MRIINQLTFSRINTIVGGSGNGTATFEKTDLGILSSVKETLSPLDVFDVFPNPVTTEAHVLFSLKNAERTDAQVQLLDAFGRVVAQYPLSASAGLNAFTIPVEGISHGLYYVNLVVDNRYSVRKIYLVAYFARIDQSISVC